MNRDRRHKRHLTILQIILSTVAIIISAAGLIINIQGKKIIDPDLIELVLDILNVLVLLLFLAILRNCPPLSFREKTGKTDYCEKFNVRIKEEKSSEKSNTEAEATKINVPPKHKTEKEVLKPIDLKEAESNNKKVNKAVRQFQTHILGYIALLMILYSIFSYDNENNEWHKIFVLVETILNFLSATFLYLGFKVLNDQTLERKSLEENEEPVHNGYWYIPAGISLLCVVVCVLVSIVGIKYSLENHKPTQNSNVKTLVNAAHLIVTNSKNINIQVPDANSAIGNNNSNQIEVAYSGRIETQEAGKIEIINAGKPDDEFWTNIFMLAAGIWNGLAMTLLFGKYISIKHSVDNVLKIAIADREDLGFNKKDLIFTGIIFLLPIYALAQPLFGSFEIDSFGDPKQFANYVFFVCLLGKVFFLYVTSLFMREQSLHYYLHLIIVQQEIPSDIRTCFEPNSESQNQKG